jgi:hypothetical protein
LVEKAYAQWNQTGHAGRAVAANTYASIEGGWTGTASAQILGSNSTGYEVDSTGTKQAVINAIAAYKAVTIGTISAWTDGSYGLYSNHAYAITGYNATTGTFTLYNPWGSDQPGQLTWAQLQASCDWANVADASGSVAINSALVRSVVVTAAVPQLTAHAATINVAEESSEWAEVGAASNETSDSWLSQETDLANGLVETLAYSRTQVRETGVGGFHGSMAKAGSLVDATFTLDNASSEDKGWTFDDPLAIELDELVA